MALRHLLAVAMVSGCALGPPPGFSQGTTWTLPLVDPLADGRLVTVLYVEDKGPYLVAIDPDAPRTMLDGTIIADGHFPAWEGPRVIDESDTGHPTFRSTLTNLRIGDLAISQRTVLVGKHLAFAGDGRPIMGVIGRDIIEDSIVFGFDRERGIAWLQTEDTYKPPSDATVLSYFRGTRERSDLVTRRLVSANVDGHAYDLHLDLGAATSQLRAEHWKEANLALVPKLATLIDEFGGRRDVTLAGAAAQVTAGPIARDRVAFVPYDDRRWDFGQLEGTLGLDFFEPYAIAADWHHERYYLTDRHDSAAARSERLARWGEAIPSTCRATGCADITIADIQGQLVARAIRDPAAAGRPLELVVRATGANGSQLPRLSVDFPPGIDEIEVGADTRYADATLEVADASPFPFTCSKGCILVEPSAPGS